MSGSEAILPSGAGRGRSSAPEAAERPEVTVIDAGVGNLGNLVRAMEHVGAAATVTEDPERVAAGRCLVLPGVGAFAPPRERLRGGLEAAIRSALDDGARLLGICVGYQLLFEASEEFGDTDGLGLLPGRVERLPATVSLPHIGWNRLHSISAGPPLEGPGGRIEEGSFVYFVHGYAPAGVPDEVVLARATHGREFPAVAGRGRIWGTQFHPEKSGAVGLTLLANFVRGAVVEAAAGETSEVRRQGKKGRRVSA